MTKIHQKNDWNHPLGECPPLLLPPEERPLMMENFPWLVHCVMAIHFLVNNLADHHFVICLKICHSNLIEDEAEENNLACHYFPLCQHRDFFLEAYR
jgi:hypothetical protein